MSGDASVLERGDPFIAVVGAREATAYGREIAKSLSKELSALGFIIVSGMAEGIDTAAHEGALEAGGKTIAVFGTGIEKTFPAFNRELRRRIEENGCCVSEFGSQAHGTPWSFPRRNRIISGLCLGVVVVEAGLKSGSLITARLAAEQGRDVFAVPGPVTSPVSQGTHQLIQGGAKLVTCVEDIVSEFPRLNLSVPSKHAQQSLALSASLPPLPKDQKRVVDLLGHSRRPTHIDELSSKSGFPLGQLSEILLELEMSGHVRTLPGSLFEASGGSHG